MIYLVTNQLELYDNPEYEIISVEDSIEMISSWDIIQYDSETTGRDARVCDLLCAQFGNKAVNTQVVVDCTTVDIRRYKNILEDNYIIGHNLKFDLQFLYNYNIIPRKVYDTMVVEQLLYLGFPYTTITPTFYNEGEFTFPYKIVIDDYGFEHYELSFSLWAVAYKYLGIDIDKSVRGEIIWRGLDTEVIKYAAGDVMYLEDIVEKQFEECTKKGCVVGAKLECDFIPSISYLEWCGIKLDEDKWKEKMKMDNSNLDKAEKALNEFTVRTPVLQQFTYIERQGSLFDGFDLTPRVNINWSSSKQVIKVAQLLGFDTKVQDKKTGKDKDSVLEKHLKAQKGINDEFLKLYFDYQEYAKVVSSFGQGHLDCVNPKTGRIHTTFKQLGASSGRLSCGSDNTNTDLAQLKKIPASRVKYPNLQQLPSDEITRSCFIPNKGNIMVSADFSAEESRLGADIYEDQEMLKEFLYGSGDMHSLFAWMVFRKECIELGCTCVADVKKKAPQWRKAVKAVEFAWMFGAAAPTIAQSAGCTIPQAEEYIKNLERGFSGVSKFAKEGSKFVRNNGYILICPITGHKKYWWDHKEWQKRQKRFNEPGFWDVYKQKHKGTGDAIAMEVREHFQAASKYDRDARNVVTQGTGAIIMKDAMTSLFNWIVDNNLFDIVKICCSVHDEIVAEYPENMKEFPSILEKTMEESAAKFCKSLPIPAEGAVGNHWIH